MPSSSLQVKINTKLVAMYVAIYLATIRYLAILYSY